MDNTDLLIKLLEQTSETVNTKIDNLSDKVDDLSREYRESNNEHKLHEKIAHNTRDLLEDHLKSDFVYQTSVDNSLKNISETLKLNTDSLIAHMKRTDILEKLHMDNAGRIESLEAPVKAKKLLKKYLITTFGVISAIAGLIYYIVGIFK